MNEIIEFQETLPAEWNMSPLGMRALQAAANMGKNPYSLYSSIPIVCRGEECPYAEVCGLYAAGIDITELNGQRCPLEIQQVIKMYNGYIQELDVDPNAIVDLTLIKELVDMDVMINRAELKMAQEGDFIQEVPVGLNNKGDVITKPDISMAAEFKEKMMKRRHEILQLLNSTRKDKAGSKLTIVQDPSMYAASLLEKAIKADYEVIDEQPVS